ncbi:MAG: DNA-3-methyladenine glycosylase [Myxococcales bacterium]|nr:DNA-3-methyladenine glycosylase [Myxococcales bacterium]
MEIVAESFYRRDALAVAPDLLGKHLRRGSVVLRITEVEAYRYPDDTANHCRMGRTARNAPMWGPPGRAYVYLCYGLHHMLNLVTNVDGEGAAVLVRSCEAVRGMETVRRRRGGRSGPELLAGPGKVGAALDLDVAMNGHALFRRGGLTVLSGDVPPAILAGPRVGIDYAAREHRLAPWRFAVADCRAVTKRTTLAPFDG